MLVGLRRTPSIPEMLRAVSLITDVDIQDIKSTAMRRPDVVDSRSLLCYMIVNVSAISGPEAALQLGWPAHTTCVQARKRWIRIRNGMNLLQIKEVKKEPFKWELDVLSALSDIQCNQYENISNSVKMAFFPPHGVRR